MGNSQESRFLMSVGRDGVCSGKPASLLGKPCTHFSTAIEFRDRAPACSVPGFRPSYRTNWNCHPQSGKTPTEEEQRAVG